MAARVANDEEVDGPISSDITLGPCNRVVGLVVYCFDANELA